MIDFNPTLGRRAVLRRLSYALGGIATAPLTSGLLAGCATPDGDALANYSYQTLNEDQQGLLAALVDQILPATDTPGAAEAGVPQFIDTMLSGWYAPEERDGFLAGLSAFDARAEGGSFLGLDAPAQAALVAAVDAETYAPAQDEPIDGDVAEAAQEGTYAAGEEQESEVAGMQGDLGESMQDDEPVELVTGEGTASTQVSEAPPFFRQLKELTLAGYYTSEVGATEELQWQASPGRYDADVPLSEVGRAWA